MKKFLEKILVLCAVTVVVALTPVTLKVGHDVTMQTPQVTVQVASSDNTLSQFIVGHALRTVVENYIPRPAWQEARADDEYNGWGQDVEPLDWILNLIDKFYGRK